MTEHDCTEMRLLVQAHVDGELTLTETSSIEAHLDRCPDCTALQGQLVALAERLRQGTSYHQVPDPLRIAVQAQTAALAQPEDKPSRVANDDGVSWWRRLSLRWQRPAAPFSAGFALAAGLAALLIVSPDGNLSDSVVSDHIRALQPNHLTDVASTDQHTVKPWFDGRLDFAPPVRDFQGQGYSLAGGRLDYLAGRQVAAMVYRRQKHVIDLFVWPEKEHLATSPRSGSIKGYNFLHWNSDGMAFWAVSDLNEKELGDFARLLRAD